MITMTYDPALWKLVPTEHAMTDGQGEAIAEMANCCGGRAYDIYRAALAAAPSAPDHPRNFFPDCGKRTPPDTVHTCTPPAPEQPAQEGLTYEQITSLLNVIANRAAGMAVYHELPANICKDITDAIRITDVRPIIVVERGDA